MIDDSHCLAVCDLLHSKHTPQSNYCSEFRLLEHFVVK